MPDYDLFYTYPLMLEFDVLYELMVEAIVCDELLPTLLLLL